MSSPNPVPHTAAEETVEQSLYEVSRKIYPRSVTGWFATWRWVFVWLTQLVFYGCCWLPWNGRQAMLFDLVERKFYIFGLVFWPQDVFFLAVLLIISAYSLFLFTAVGGRLWCGYACPQTVYTSIFLYIEEKVEGNRMARMKLDSLPLSLRKVYLKAGKHAIWIIFSLWTGFTFVGYFTPIKTLTTGLLHLDLGPWEIFWILFYGLATYGNAGWLREQVCKYMCPYARFQGVMFDPDTLTVTYDRERGEPRGSRARKTDHREKGLGDCIDCQLCVAVCPTGIDIRDGLQYECIGCAACIDVCDQVMDKMDYPRGLIRYSTENAIEKHWGWRDILGHVIRPRVLVYSGVLMVIVIAFLWGLAVKPELRVDVLRDRAALAREVEGGLIENVYRLQVMNVSEIPQRYEISVQGLKDIQLIGPRVVAVAPATTQALTLQVRVPPESGKTGASTIYFDLRSVSNPRIAVHEKARFLLP
ncbi:MAG: cytochrome c oxidase accessory protein CcoG [Proteobacteria bacterium]|nr:cytochrome c oxidase accessory protein CcoG [Pseudomonadota bacterium]HQR03459.1 cytochrome c oxidase accessory protein CcoG [Rhodocyclaceae bacterium]